MSSDDEGDNYEEEMEEGSDNEDGYIEDDDLDHRPSCRFIADEAMVNFD